MTYLTLKSIASSGYLRKLEFIKQTAEQLSKDFELFGFVISFSGNAVTAYEELYNQLLPIITKLSVTNYPKLLQLLYRIDINEGIIATAVKEEQGVLENVLTRLIIYRELQKVLFRDYFKNGGQL